MEYTFQKTSNLVENGSYECLLEKIEPKVYDGERTVWELNFKIRDDIESNDKRFRKWYLKVFVSYGAYYDARSEKVLTEIINTQKFDGTQKHFDTEEDVLQFLKGLLCVVVVQNYVDKKDGKLKQAKHFKPTNYQPKKIEEPVEEGDIVGTDLSDEEMPWYQD